MNLTPEDVRERMSRDLSRGYEPALDVTAIARRASAMRSRRVGLASTGTVAVVAAAVVLGSSILGNPSNGRDGDRVTSDPAVEAATDVRVDTENAPPKKFIAAGRVAVSATWSMRQQNVVDGLKTLRRSWSLYNPNTGTYDETPYTWVDVAPGLELSAVLEGDLPSDRVGIFDMKTRKVRSWIDLDHPVASVTWSPDGKTVLATAYDKDPDLFQVPDTKDGSSGGKRTGFFLIDVASGAAIFSALGPIPASSQPAEFPVATGVTGDTEAPPEESVVPATEITLEPGGPMSPEITSPPTAAPSPAGTSGEPVYDAARQDLRWSSDGSMLWSPTQSEGYRVYYDLQGKRVSKSAQPDATAHIFESSQSAISPDGKLIIGVQSGLPTSVLDRETGKKVGEQEMLQLLAWADDDHLIALGGCSAPCRGTTGDRNNEFFNGLFLVSVDGREKVQLSAIEDRTEGGWQWLLTQR